MARLSRSVWPTLLIAAIVLAAAGYSIVNMGGRSASPKLGRPAPEFTLTTLDGREVSLADYRGKGVLLNFWATWCTPCVNELPLLNEAAKMMEGVDVVAVNIGEQREAVARFAERYDLEFAVLLDAEKRVNDQYKVRGLPATWLIDEEGVVVSRKVGEMTEFEEIIRLMTTVQPTEDIPQKLMHAK